MDQNKKTIIYIDLDDTLCDYSGAKIKASKRRPYLKYPQSEAGFFQNLSPITEGIEAAFWLCDQPAFDVYILTAPSKHSPSSYTEKRLWVEEHLSLEMALRMIISPNKGLLRGDFLIDDKREGSGQDQFEGEHIHFGSADYPNWASVRTYFEKLLKDNQTKEKRNSM